MKNKTKYIIIISLICIICLFVIVFIGSLKDGVTKYGEFSAIDNEGKIYNTSEKLKTVKQYQNYFISNIEIIGTVESSILTANIKNSTGKNAVELNVYFELLDNNEKVVDTVLAFIPQIDNEEEKNVNIAIDKNIVDIYDVKCYVIKAD